VCIRAICEDRNRTDRRLWSWLESVLASSSRFALPQSQVAKTDDRSDLRPCASHPFFWSKRLKGFYLSVSSASVRFSSAISIVYVVGLIGV